jgi:ABC-2 type transport system permease protein
MRLRNVFTKSLYDRRHGLVWWSLAIALLTGAVLSAWPSARDEAPRLVAIAPPAVLGFFGIER